MVAERGGAKRDAHLKSPDFFDTAEFMTDVNQLSHDNAMKRVIQAGAKPVTALSVMLELQRDWAILGTYDAVMDIVKTHFGAYGSGVEYAYTKEHKGPATVFMETSRRRVSDRRRSMGGPHTWMILASLFWRTAFPPCSQMSVNNPRKVRVRSNSPLATASSRIAIRLIASNSIPSCCPGRRRLGNLCGHPGPYGGRNPQGARRRRAE